MRKMSQAQADRQNYRDRAGRYEQSYRCELCGSTTGNYCSDERCNSTGLGLVLCDKCARALAIVPDDRYTATLTRSTALPVAERRGLRDDLLAAEQAERTGCVSLRLSRRGSGPVVGVYRQSRGWYALCEEHNQSATVRTVALAKSAAVDPCDFCDACRGNH